MTIKEQTIKDYISDINFKSENWSIDDMKRDMRKFLGEEPAIDVTYEKVAKMNEDHTKSYESLDIKDISIIFYDTDEKFKKIKIKP